MNRSQSDGVLYQLTGTKHGLNLLVSIYSLREHQYDGPIAILAGCRESQDIAVLEKNIADVKSWLNQIPPERKPRWAKQT